MKKAINITFWVLSVSIVLGFLSILVYASIQYPPIFVAILAGVALAASIIFLINKLT